MKHTILLVDDDPLILKTLKDRFASSLFEVHVAATPQAAQEEMLKFLPEVVLLDVLLTSGDGGETILQFMKSQPQLEHVPVLVLTNLEDEARKKKILGLGVREYLEKGSVSLDEVYDKLINYLEPEPSY